MWALIGVFGMRRSNSNSKTMQQHPNYARQFGIPSGPAICYSGYRAGQAPGEVYPTYQQVREDLLLISDQWKYIRLYSCDMHSKTVLDVLQKEQIPIKVMLGAYIVAEENNSDCPWGGEYDQSVLEANRKKNQEEISCLVALSNEYPEIIFSLSVGNEACVDWTDHMVPVERVIEYARFVRSYTVHPVTFCENYVPWLDKLLPLAEELDFISIHTYPVWEHKNIEESLEFTQQNFLQVAEKHPGKLIVITEAGWTTQSNDQGIPKENVGEAYQKIYYERLSHWCAENEILAFFFEAFDEPWKGSADPLEPEKHWGVFFEDRKPKMVLQPKSYKAT